MRETRSTDESLVIEPNFRVLYLAPHPDDEVLAAGGLLHSVQAAGARVSVVFVTSGEDNPWPQRLMDRRWRITRADRARWAERRRDEALASLHALGIGAPQARFLGFPDQRLTSMLLRGDGAFFSTLRRVIHTSSPTHVVYPSPLDYHPDHSALGVAVRTLRDAAAPGVPRPRHLEYLIHDAHQRPAGTSIALRLAPDQVEAKRAGIRCHASQLLFRRNELLAFAASEERFVEPPLEPTEEPDHPIRSLRLEGERLVLSLRRRRCWRAFGRASVCLLLPGSSGPERAWWIGLGSGSRELSMRDLTGRQCPDLARYRGAWDRGEVSIPTGPLPRDLPIYAKLMVRYGFFDEAGWRAIPRLPARVDAKPRDEAALRPALEPVG